MLLDLPEEVSLCVCSFLTVQDLCALACVCRHLGPVTTDPMLWRDLFESSSDKAITMAPPLPPYILALYHPPVHSNINNVNNNNNNINNNINNNNNNNNNSSNNNNNNSPINNSITGSSNNTHNISKTHHINNYNYEIEEDFRYWKFLCKSSRNFESVSEALKEAKPYSFIHIRPGTYEDNFTVTKPVHIIGIGEDNSKVVLENKPSIGRVMIVSIVMDEEPATPPTPPSPPLAEHFDPPATPLGSPPLPSSPSPPLLSPPSPSSPTHSVTLPPPSASVSLPLPLPSLRNCTLRQKTTHPNPQNFCIEITSGAFLIEDCVICSESLSCICVQKEGAPIIRRNSIYGTSAGLTTFECSSDTLVEENQFYNNAYSAIEISLYANPIIRRNNIFDGKSAGIFVFDHGRGLIEDNNIYGNASSGIEVAREAAPTVYRNKIHHGKGCGISVYEKSTGVFEENEIYDNFESNIYISRLANPVFLNNKIYRSKLSGVYIHHEGAGYLEGNEIYENMNEGVATVDESNPKLVNNVVRDNKRAGIVVYDKGMGYFEKNIVSHNVGGIEVRRMGKPTLIGNVLVDNEIVPAELRACIERGECTFSATGVSFFPQYWWYCDTCEGGGDKGCCASCAAVCHKGHKISQRKFSLFYCDCGAEWCCRVMPNRKNPYD